MGNLAEGILRLLSLLLVFLLGFFSFFGVLVGAGLFAYKGLTYDRLVAWGINLPSTDGVIEDPDVYLTSMTIEDAIKEVSLVRSYGNAVTIDFLIDRYGLVLPENVLAYLPDALRAAPLSTLFTKDGIVEVLHGIPVSLIFDVIPDNVLSPAAKAELSDKTFGDLLDHDLEYLLDGVRLGYLLAPLNVTYVLEDGVYVQQYADPQSPTVLEVISPLRVGEVLVNIKNKSDLLAVVSEDIGDALISQLLGPLSDINPILSGVLEGKTLNDILVKNEETGEYTVNVFALVSNRTVGDILGYEPIYYNNDPSTFIVGWSDGGTPVTGAILGLCFCEIGEVSGVEGLDYVTILENFYLGYALDCEPKFESDGSISAWTQQGEAIAPYYRNLVFMSAGELIRDGATPETILDGIYIGELMNATRVTDPVSGDIYWDKNGEKMTGVEAVMADKLVTDVMNGELGLDEISIATLLGLHEEVLPLCEEGSAVPMTDADGEIITRSVWIDDATGNEADHMLGAIADASIDSISSIVSTLTIGDVTGNFSLPKPGDPTKTVVYSGTIDTVGGEKVYVVTKATGVLKALTDSPINDLSGAVDSILIGDALSLYEGDDGVWYKDPECTEPQTGIQKALAPKTIGEIGSAMDDILVGDALDYTYDEATDTWYTSPDMTQAVTGIQKVLAPKKIGEIGSAMDDILVGDALDYTYDEATDAWYTSPDLAPEHAVTGIQKVLAPKKIGEIGSAMDSIKIGEVLGWTYVTAPDGHWITGYDGAEKEIPATGLMLNFADLTVNEMSDSGKVADAVQNAKIGDAMGYYEDKTVTPSVWYTSSAKTEQPSGIMGVLADTKLSEVDTKINATEIGTLMGNHKNELDGKWYSDAGFTTPVSPQIMNKISNATLNTVGSVMDTLTLGDVLDPGAFAAPASGERPSFFYLLRWTDDETGITYYREDIPVEQLGNACNQTFEYISDNPTVMAPVP